MQIVNDDRYRCFGDCRGIGRAARYVLPMVVAHAHGRPGGRRCAEALTLLPPDPVGTVAARLAAKGIGAMQPAARAGALFGHLLEPSLPSAARALARRVREIGA